MEKETLENILKEFGKRVPPGSQLHLLGGGALTLLGSPRPSLDIDFVGDDVHPNELHRTILTIAKEMDLFVDAVPIDRFVPLPEGHEKRAIHIGQFENLEIFVIDPYSIALSKVDRGAFTDYDDILFLIQKRYIDISKLEEIIKEAVAKAGKYDLHPEILSHFEELKSRLS